MTGNYGETSDYYANLFKEDPSYATPYPNLDEAIRWAKICEFLSQIPKPERHGIGQRLRILDVGCGNGWLTYLANIYGRCEGVDPSAGSIEQAREYFPELSFYVGTVTNVLQSPNFRPYDVVITSEVIEHVIDKESFVVELGKCLRSRGHVIITTPRGEEMKKYFRTYVQQPIEAWISEKELCRLFERHQFAPIRHDHAYIPLPEMTLLHRLSAIAYENPRVSHALTRFGLTWAHKALQHPLGIYQVWWFRSREPSREGFVQH
jgi:SAM-dependent methyltransferase